MSVPSPATSSLGPRLKQAGREFAALLWREWRLDWRQRQALFSLVLYAGLLVFTLALGVRGRLPLVTWAPLFWLLQLFVAVSAAGRSFLNEPEGRQWYLYQVADPSLLLLAKLAYSWGVLFLLGLISGLMYSALLGAADLNLTDAAAVLAAGSLSLAAPLTLMAALTSRAGGKTLLLTVLAFPLLLPQLLTLIRLTNGALAGLLNTQNLLVTLGFDGVLVAAALLLFPLLWRD